MGSIREIAKQFQVGKTFVNDLVQQWRKTGSVSPLPHAGGVKPKLEAEHLQKLQQGVIHCYKLKRYQEALPYFEKTLELMQKLDIKGGLATCAANIFNCHVYLKNKQQAEFYLNMAKSLTAQSDSLEDQGIVTMAIANAYWGRDEIWHKAWGIVLVIKALIIIPPWRSANGRLAMQVAIKQIFGLSS